MCMNIYNNILKKKKNNPNGKRRYNKLKKKYFFVIFDINQYTRTTLFHLLKYPYFSL